MLRAQDQKMDSFYGLQKDNNSEVKPDHEGQYFFYEDKIALQWLGDIQPKRGKLVSYFAPKNL